MVFTTFLVLFFYFGCVYADGVVSKLSWYECIDIEYNADRSEKINLEYSRVLLPRTVTTFIYEKGGLMFLSQGGDFVGLFNLRMYCSMLRQDTSETVYGWNGQYSGSVFLRDDREININTVTMAPVIQGRIGGDGKVRGRLVSMTGYSIADGAALDEFSFGVTTEDYFGCQFNMEGTTYGCVYLTNYNPTVKKTSNPAICNSHSGEEPVIDVNCGPAQKITRSEESVQSVEESISITSSSSSTLEIGASFQVTAGVKVDGGVASASAGVSASVSTSLGMTSEKSQQNARTASSVRTQSNSVAYTLDHGLRHSEFKNKQYCKSSGVAKGCLDTQCTISFKLDYETERSLEVTRREVSTVDCSTIS